MQQTAFTFTDDDRTTTSDTRLQRWRLAPPCAHGTPTESGTPHAVGWSGPHHCVFCWIDVECACRQFAADVAAGLYDEKGYTSAERRALAKKHGQKKTVTYGT